MKLPRIFLVCAMALSAFLPSGIAGVVKQDDGTFLISGTWTFWSEREMLSSSGKFDLGEFKSILFKPSAINFEGMREMKKTAAAFKVKARESVSATGEKVLVVEEILEKVE